MSRKRGFERCYPGSSRPWRVCRGYDKNGAGCGGVVVGVAAAAAVTVAVAERGSQRGG